MHNYSPFLLSVIGYLANYITNLCVDSTDELSLNKILMYAIICLYNYSNSDK